MNRLINSGALAIVAGVALIGGCASDQPLVADGAWIERVATGFAFTEGPAWDGQGNLYFTDIPNNQIIRFEESTETLSVVKHDSGAANGLMFDRRGRLFAAQGGAQRVMRLDGDREVVLAAYSGIYRLNSPNDIVLDRDGGVYFTDPRYGDRSTMELKVEGVYYIAPDGEVTRIIENLVRPNGLILSRDGKTLYVADNGAKNIWAYDVMGPGKLCNGRVFAWMDVNAGGGGDGMTIDQFGNIYCAGQGGIWIWSPEGVLLEQITVPEAPANCAFGGADGKTLYITARTSLYRIRMNVRGG